MRLEVVDRVTRRCAHHAQNPTGVYECAACQRASVIVVRSAMTGEPMLRGIGGARPLRHGLAKRVLEYDEQFV